MAEFFVATSYGLVGVLQKELQALGVSIRSANEGGVFFEGNWETCYRVNLHSRVASRVLKPVLDFPAYKEDELYHNVRQHDFTKYLLNPGEKTLRVEASVRDCGAIHDQRMVMLKVKDAIVDQFRDQVGIRPNITPKGENPDICVHIHGYRDQYHVAIDTSGESLFRRGYRRQAGLAPLKENLAAGLLYLSEWDGLAPLYDPMCGSGTLPIEAALMALRIAPGTLRKGFGFMKLRRFQEDPEHQQIWDRLLEEAMDGEERTRDLSSHPLLIWGSDKDRGSVKMARENARRAGVDEAVRFHVDQVTSLRPPTLRSVSPDSSSVHPTPSSGDLRGLMVTNPPYGCRWGEEDALKDVFRDLGYVLKHQFQGWTAWILSGNGELTAELKLRATQKFRVFNGPIDCRFLKYEMR